MSMADRRAELLQDLVERSSEMMRDHGVDGDVADQVAAALADFFSEHWGGHVVSFPKDTAYRLALRDCEVLQAARTMTLPELARRFSLGERAIRRLLKRANARLAADSQLPLF